MRSPTGDSTPPSQYLKPVTGRPRAAKGPNSRPVPDTTSGGLYIGKMRITKTNRDVNGTVLFDEIDERLDLVIALAYMFYVVNRGAKDTRYMSNIPSGVFDHEASST